MPCAIQWCHVERNIRLAEDEKRVKKQTTTMTFCWLRHFRVSLYTALEIKFSIH